MHQSDMNLDNSHCYRDPYRRLMKYLLVLTTLSTLLIIALSTTLLAQRYPNYYISTSVGHIQEIYPLSEPMLTKPYLRQWGSTVVRAAYNLDFLKVDTQLKELSKNFTPKAWTEFKAILENSGLTTSIKKNKLVVSGIVNGPVIILQQYVKNGVFTWQLQMPVLVTYNSASESKQQTLTVTINVVRKFVLNTEQVIQINAFNAG